jgi:glycine cleavage system transcriptional repressor
MSANIVLTLTGKDRVGIVEELTRLLLNLDGNVETSRMARLGGEFAVLMLVALPAEHRAQLEQDLHGLEAQGYKLTTNQTDLQAAEALSGWVAYQIEVSGADHEGIIHDITQALSKRGITIESMETGTRPAPNSGTPLFAMTAVVLAPPAVDPQAWQTELEETGERLNVEVTVTAAAR